MNTHRDNTLPEIKELFESFGDIKGKRILELGQGMDTQFREYFESVGLIYKASDTYVGINNGTEKLSGDEYFYDSMENLENFDDESLDIVFSCHAFEHCENPLQALKEAKRALKNGGRLVMVTPWCCKHHIIDADSDHIFVLNQYQLIRLLHYAGFETVGVIEQKNILWKEQDFNYIIIGDKNE